MPIPITVDLVLATVADNRLQVLLGRRAGRGFGGRRWALPGRFLGPDDELATTARELLADVAGGRGGQLEQLATVGPVGGVVSIAYVALVAGAPSSRTGDRWHEVEEILADPARLALDHGRIIAAAAERVRTRLEHTAAAAALCPPAFTVTRLREVYEAVWGVRLDPANFHRKLAAAGVLEPTGDRAEGHTGRPPALYRADPSTPIHPAIVRDNLR
ncbi:NUDIX hydrolase [Amycolatopsis keratiniphila]|uniref:NUDIX hydrolase n=1 Tax=Amycolatopsis keratiniphila TaxID=129921 RepID=UPI000B232653|nr:NUDIX domain-containing protein [Amycolatopsis keratiniphila]